MLSRVVNELLWVVPTRPLASVVVSVDCHSVGYSPRGPWSDDQKRSSARPDNRNDRVEETLKLLNSEVVRICEAKNTGCPVYRIFGRSPNVERLRLVVCGIKVGLPEGSKVRLMHLHETLVVGQASARLPQLALGLSAAEVAAVGLLSTWPDRPFEPRATLWASAEVLEAFGLFHALRATGIVWPLLRRTPSARPTTGGTSPPSRKRPTVHAWLPLPVSVPILGSSPGASCASFAADPCRAGQLPKPSTSFKPAKSEDERLTLAMGWGRVPFWSSFRPAPDRTGGRSRSRSSSSESVPGCLHGDRLAAVINGLDGDLARLRHARAGMMPPFAHARRVAALSWCGELSGVRASAAADVGFRTKASGRWWCGGFPRALRARSLLRALTRPPLPRVRSRAARRAARWARP
jgi:hypothetical protein